MIPSIEIDITKVREWLLTQNKNMTDIDLDYDLIENRVIDSLQIVEFLLFLESITGREVYTSDFSLDQIKTLQAIYDNFLKESA
jgi:acyl carrier protein